MTSEKEFDEFCKDLDELIEDDFIDVQPLTEGLEELGYGKYSKSNVEHRTIFDYFRRILSLDEFSKRGFY